MNMIVLFIALIVLIALGMPVAFSLGITSLWYLFVNSINLSTVAQSMSRGVNSFTMLAIPFFFLAGELMNTSGVTDRIIRMAKVLVGHFKGGLAQVNIVASIIFAGISGSATADAAALGSALIPAMEKEGYDTDFSAAITVASSMVGPIIPPSITLVMYGILAQVPIGQLLAAGILPGLVLALSQMVYTYYYSKKMDYPRYEKANFKEFTDATKSGVSALIMPIIIIGGVLSGVFTPTESAAIAVFYGVFVGLVVYKNMTLGSLFETIKKVSIASVNNLFILACATAFSWVMTKARVPEMVIDLVFSISNNETIILFILVVFLLLIGLFMLPSQALIVLTPIFVPVAKEIGVDPVHFGIIMVLTLTLGGCTPPVGMMLYVVADISKLQFTRLVKAVTPLYIPIIIAIILVTFVPSISMILPILLFR
ncbi:MAG: TRAP transporter large permease [Maledivibacter sp.]|jgi:C4-dicarboxylate transporter DctM subunit|nr:TRAP transporter large permease [Maledivibacter sp.]